MTFAQYCRIETAAGGVHCTNREFIRAARALLSTDGKARAQRKARHMWIRDGLDQLESARRAYLNIYLGSEEKTETIEQILQSDIAGRFDITRAQAERIADRATDGADFVRIWENEDWWK